MTKSCYACGAGAVNYKKVTVGTGDGAPRRRLEKRPVRQACGASRKNTGRSIVGGRAGTSKNMSQTKPR